MLLLLDRHGALLLGDLTRPVRLLAHHHRSPFGHLSLLPRLFHLLARFLRVVRRLRRRSDVELVVVPGGRHAMLRHARTFHRLTADFVVRGLLGT